MTYKSFWTDLMDTEITQGYISAGAVRTRYWSAGSESKPLLLLLHGIGGHVEAYSRNIAAHSKHFWTVAVDFLGHGLTERPAGLYELPRYAEHILAVLKALGRESAHISGESLGGWIAAHLAVHHPEVVNRLVLNTAAGWTAHPEVMARIKHLSIEAATDPTWERIKTRLEFLMHDKSKVTDDLIATRQKIYSQEGFADTMRSIMCLQEMDIRRRNMISKEQYNSIKAPTLVLWTSHDPTATPEEGKQIADMIPGSRYVVMNECGHWPQFEDVEVFNKIHLAFLLER